MRNLFVSQYFLSIMVQVAKVYNVQVTQPVGYVGTLPAIRVNESTAEWTARDCYV